LCENCKNDEKLDSGSLLNALFEKMMKDPRWKVFVRHSGSERRLSGVFWMSHSQQDLYQQSSWAKSYLPFQFNAGIPKHAICRII
jgi:hypothetical protein